MRAIYIFVLTLFTLSLSHAQQVTIKEKKKKSVEVKTQAEPETTEVEVTPSTPEKAPAVVEPVTPSPTPTPAPVAEEPPTEMKPASEFIAAKTKTSKPLFQAAPDSHWLDVFLNYASQTAKISGDGKNEQDLIGLGVSYERGLAGVSFQAVLAYSSGELRMSGDPKADVAGFKDLEIWTKADQHLTEALRLAFGSRVSIGLEDAEIKSNGDRNAASGANSYAVFLGLEQDLGGAFIGARYLIDLIRTDRTVEDKSLGQDLKYDGGYEQLATLFFENHFNEDTLLGFSASYQGFSDSRLESTQARVEEPEYIGFKLYFETGFSESVLFYPSVQYKYLCDKTLNGVKYKNDETWLPEIRVQFLF